MELRHLKYLSAVASEGGFGRAAGVLNLAQPALSRQIRDLEEEIGVTLFDRTPKGAVVTAAGDAFLESAARVLSAAAGAMRGARLSAAGLAGRCQLAVDRITVRVEAVTTWLERLPEYVPGLELSIQELDESRQWEMLATGELDIGITPPPPAGFPLESELLLLTGFGCALVSADHPLAGRDELLPADLAKEPVLFLSPSRACGLAELCGWGLDHAGIRSPREFVYASPQSAVMIVASGRGWTPVPTAVRARPPEGTVAVPVRGLDFPLRADVIWRPRETRPVVSRVLQALRALRDGTTHEEQRPSVALSPSAPVPPGLELRDLRYFAAVVDEGSFGRAATRLGVTQPSLSRQVAELEYLVGATLLTRGARGVLPTEAGRALREGIELVFSAVEDMIVTAQRTLRGRAARCVVGAVQTKSSARLLAALSRECRRRPKDVDLILEDCASPHQAAALREGKIDVGLAHAFPATDEADVARERLVDDTIDCVLVARTHPLAAREQVSAADLADMPFLFMPRSQGPAFYDRVMVALGRLGLTPRIEAGIGGLDTTWCLAARGRGWCLGFATHRENPPSGLVAIPLDGLCLPWGLDLLHRRSEASPVVLGILNRLRVAAGAAQPTGTAPLRMAALAG